MIRIVLIFLFASLNGFAQVSKTMKRLPDTGETTSYTATFGEDNDYNINIPTYANNGDGTITDTVTGLMWQSIDGGEMKIEDAINYCDTLSLAGYTNWRLPTAQEAFSILILQNANPAINTTYFPNTNAEYWWTIERQANDTNKIWVTNAGGGIGNHLRTETISAGGTKKIHVRAVRDITSSSMIPVRFVDNGDSTITDNLTNLVWQKFPPSLSQTWEQALTYAEGLNLASQSDWRLPNIKELQSLNDETVVQPSVTTPFFQNVGVNKYWSSTTLPNQTTKAWYWNTAFGITTYDDKINSNKVLCVRNITTIPNAIQNTELNIKLTIYPNPFNRHLNIQNIPNNSISILYNTIGEVVFKGKGIENQNFSSLPNGIYILQVENERFKLIKE